MIEIFYEDYDDLNLDNTLYNNWLSRLCANENKVLSEVSLIFCSDNFLLEINQQHLNHDYFTDIVTFDYCVDDSVSGDLFVSVDRVKENAISFNVDFMTELHRVIAHGVLHLCGYKDKSDEDIVLMRSKEDYALSLI
jgi:probable rRNA maturation factor